MAAKATVQPIIINVKLVTPTVTLVGSTSPSPLAVTVTKVAPDIALSAATTSPLTVDVTLVTPVVSIV